MLAKALLYLLTLIYLTFLLSIILKIRSKTDLLNTSKSTDTSIVDLELQMFNDYVTRFNKTYSAREYTMRLNNFKVSLAEVARLNALEKNAVFGLTEFSDMSAQEFVEQMLMKRVYGDCLKYNRLCPNSDNVNFVTSTPLAPIRDKIDWREQGVIGPVLNQKQCLGCWAFSIAGVMETMANINNISKEALSVQQILDCLVDKDQNGCKGGNVASALSILCDEQQDILTAERYPLTLYSETCQKRDETGIKLKSFIYKCKAQMSVNESEENIQRALMDGPVTAVVNAAIWRYYLGGIITRACVRGEDSYDHAIQIVGYDRTGEIPYYIIKNSWGESFGDHGYVKLEMYKNMCGIAEEIGIIDVK